MHMGGGGGGGEGDNCRILQNILYIVGLVSFINLLFSNLIDQNVTGNHDRYNYLLFYGYRYEVIMMLSMR